MKNKSDPLTVLIEINSELGSLVDDELIKACYLIQKEHQYDKDRNTVKQIQDLVEAAVVAKTEAN